MMRKTSLIMLLTVGLVFTSISITQAQTPQETLNQYISDLQKNPNDNALREKIIKHVQEMKQKPAIPEEARRYFVKAVTMQKEAKNTKGFEIAVNAYKQALLIAPWWPEAYYNLSIALESAGQYDEAVKALKLYMVTNPSASEVRAVQDKIYAIEAKKEISQVQEVEKRKLVEEKKGPRETGRDGRFIAYDNGTVLDTLTNLMWAAKDNGGSSIDWYDAKLYCENYRGGGYTDWRMPTMDELAGLYEERKAHRVACKGGNDSIRATGLIDFSCYNYWASETDGTNAAFFYLASNQRGETTKKHVTAQALPVRLAK